MSSTFIWLMIICMGLVTYAERGSFILFLGNRKFPPLLERSLRFVPPAVLSALVVPAFLYREEILDISLGNYKLIAAVVAALFAWWTSNVIVTISVGMVCLWLLQYFFG
ncbi:MAG: branched-subunit amino acid transport protein [Cellvibrionaceae bacterium]|jgi:branched-subunit amino acid transport protein